MTALLYDERFMEYLMRFKDDINQNRLLYDLGIPTYKIKFYEHSTFPYFQVTRTGILFQQNEKKIAIIRWEDYDESIKGR